jgi:hypothetical protein
MAQFRKDTHQYLNQEKTLFETVMLADKYGNLVGAANPSGAAIDAFGRARSSHPFTLFDSSHRYQDNNKFNTANTAGGTCDFNANTCTMNLSVDNNQNTSVYRESKRVFSYQPGKSLLFMTTFSMDAAKTGLRQRIGYFGSDNGYYLERSSRTSTGVCLVRRSKVSGIVDEVSVDQAEWNVDKLDGNGPSHLTLNLDNPQILFLDMEWLGVGSVRIGFVINGELIVCHAFHHANQTSSTNSPYIQTACLPIRYEIENTANTTTSSVLKQICSTVISEGGYELSGRPRTIGLDPQAATQRTLTTAGTYYPVVSIRLNPDTPDAIVLPNGIDIMPINSGNYRYQLVHNADIIGAEWANVTSSVIQYNTNTTATMSGGNTLISGYVTSTVQGAGQATISGDRFVFQLERNTFTGNTSTLTLAVTCGTNSSNVCGSIQFEEVVF